MLKLSVDRGARELLLSAPDAFADLCSFAGQRSRSRLTRPEALVPMLAGRPQFPHGMRVFSFAGQASTKAVQRA